MPSIMLSIVEITRPFVFELASRAKQENISRLKISFSFKNYGHSFILCVV